MQIDYIDGRTGAVINSAEIGANIRLVNFPAIDGGRLAYEVMKRADGSAFIVLDDNHAECMTGERTAKPAVKQ